MALIFPEDRTSYPASMRFTVMEEVPGGGSKAKKGSQVELYMPAGIQFADKVEYENVGLGAMGLAASGGGPSLNQYFSDLVNFDDGAKMTLASVVGKFSERAGAVARERTKTAPNPNTRALFKQVSLRSFQFSFKLIPISSNEAESIKQIIKLFRTEMYPEDILMGDDQSLGYKFPNKFNIEFLSNGSIIDGIKVADSYLEACSVSYNPTNQTILGNSKSGNFSEIDLNLTFTESRALSRNSIIKEGF
jgi:hypothetical protein